ncbi:Bax inhibitor-1 family protein [Neisseria leonii]|uniref:Bax inhibitor-1 family protein n=1 Tax=Neisseria leonii TaxID=2995413 RepID=A0A9X4IDU1_9NEIS|nr:Bax inhibitor-1 family protein [Neisseria sp. 51.81]MDD9328046.1 Bax inhibitor-1 family protein [Neisseria sp. 51.81]
MRNDVYDYTGSRTVSQSSVLRKTYALLAASFVPCALGAYAAAATGFNLAAVGGNRWIGLIAMFAFFYGMIFLIERNRYSNLGAGLLMVFTFGMGALISPLLQYSLNISGGSALVGTAAVMTAAVFAVMSLMARSDKVNTQSLGRFLTIGVIVLMIAIVANLFLQLPALSLTIASGFVVFSSLMIMWQTRTVIEGGETSHISAALTIFISIYNLFSSLLQILLSFAGNDD